MRSPNRSVITELLSRTTTPLAVQPLTDQQRQYIEAIAAAFPEERERAEAEVRRMVELLEKEGKIMKAEDLKSLPPLHIEKMKRGATIVIDSVMVDDVVRRTLVERLPQEKIRVVSLGDAQLELEPRIDVKQLIASLPKPLEAEQDYEYEQAKARMERKAERKKQRPAWRK